MVQITNELYIRDGNNNNDDDGDADDDDDDDNDSSMYMFCSRHCIEDSTMALYQINITKFENGILIWSQIPYVHGISGASME